MNEGLVVFVRASISFLCLLIFTRILGKQQISQLTFHDYVLGITIGSIAGSLTTDLSSRAFPHFIGLVSWCAFGLITELCCMKSTPFHRLLKGDSTIVISNGKILIDNLRSVKYTLGELIEILRNKDIFDLNEIEVAILETTGDISVLKKTEFQQPTKKDINSRIKKSYLPYEVILEGEVIKENLEKVNYSEDKLKELLSKEDVNEFKEVFLAMLDEQGNIYINKYD